MIPVTPAALAGLLPAIRAVAMEAGRATLGFYHADVQSRRKDDGSPVTLADEAAEAVILEALRRLTPDIPIVSEEAHARSATPALDGRFWLVDPLDGTKEFIKRNGEFTVNIALVDQGVPVLGVVYVPVTEELYSAAGPGTAHRAHHREGDRPIAARPAPADGLTVMSSRSHAGGEALERFLKDYPVKERLSAGSSLKFCRIAEGRADLYPRLGPTMEWDTAAGHAVLLAAGGRVETMEGRALGYGKPGLINPHFVAFGA